MSRPTIALVGNPNCGKSTLFNALTGSRQRIGNWPGVTVERKIGSFCLDNQEFDVIDLPGTYQLTTLTHEQSIDVRVACETILSGDVDMVVNVIDATNLERQLFLTAQLLEMDVPVVIAANMMDVVHKCGMNLNLAELESEIGVPVVGIAANKGDGIEALQQMVVQTVAATQQQPNRVNYSLELTQAIASIQAQMPATQKHQRWHAIHLLEGDVLASDHLSDSSISIATLSEEPDILIADARYQWAQDISIKVKQAKMDPRINLSWRIDQIVLHRIAGIPIFLAMMYFMFLFAINVGSLFQDFFDMTSSTLFVDGATWLLNQIDSPLFLTNLLANGVGRGINTVLTFIPVIGSMYLFLALLESSGYMARAAFVVDRAMRVVGLPGKSFVPMIVGFGCNVSAIMAARTLENRRDRILTIMMSPFMSCSARLAIYAVFTAAFFPSGGHNVVFALYLIGIVMAVLTGLLLRKTLLKGQPAELVMEMPNYHLPTFSVLLRQAWFRLKSFIYYAGRLIIPVCVVLSLLQHVQLNPQQTLLEKIGQSATPIFTPMGIEKDNWPATVSLITGVLAKEVVIGTLNTLYHQDQSEDEPMSLRAGLMAGLQSIPANFNKLTQSLLNPIAAVAPEQEVSQSVYGVMYQRFGGPLAAFAFLLFVLLYFPCVSATAAMVKELSAGWALFSVLWTTGVAYCVATVFYQCATLSAHVTSSLSWVIGIVVFAASVLWAMRSMVISAPPQGLN